MSEENTTMEQSAVEHENKTTTLQVTSLNPNLSETTLLELGLEGDELDQDDSIFDYQGTDSPASMSFTVAKELNVSSDSTGHVNNVSLADELSAAFEANDTPEEQGLQVNLAPSLGNVIQSHEGTHVILGQSDELRKVESSDGEHTVHLQIGQTHNVPKLDNTIELFSSQQAANNLTPTDSASTFPVQSSTLLLDINPSRSSSSSRSVSLSPTLKVEPHTEVTEMLLDSTPAKKADDAGEKLEPSGDQTFTAMQSLPQEASSFEIKSPEQSTFSMQSSTLLLDINPSRSSSSSRSVSLSPTLKVEPHTEVTEMLLDVISAKKADNAGEEVDPSVDQTFIATQSLPQEANLFKVESPEQHSAKGSSIDIFTDASRPTFSEDDTFQTSVKVNLSVSPSNTEKRQPVSFVKELEPSAQPAKEDSDVSMFQSTVSTELTSTHVVRNSSQPATNNETDDMNQVHFNVTERNADSLLVDLQNDKAELKGAEHEDDSVGMGEALLDFDSDAHAEVPLVLSDIITKYGSNNLAEIADRAASDNLERSSPHRAHYVEEVEQPSDEDGDFVNLNIVANDDQVELAADEPLQRVEMEVNQSLPIASQTSNQHESLLESFIEISDDTEEAATGATDKEKEDSVSEIVEGNQVVRDAIIDIVRDVEIDVNKTKDAEEVTSPADKRETISHVGEYEGNDRSPDEPMYRAEDSNQGSPVMEVDLDRGGTTDSEEEVVNDDNASESIISETVEEPGGDSAGGPHGMVAAVDSIPPEPAKEESAVSVTFSNVPVPADTPSQSDETNKSLQSHDKEFDVVLQHDNEQSAIDDSLANLDVEVIEPTSAGFLNSTLNDSVTFKHADPLATKDENLNKSTGSIFEDDNTLQPGDDTVPQSGMSFFEDSTLVPQANDSQADDHKESLIVTEDITPWYSVSTNAALPDSSDAQVVEEDMFETEKLSSADRANLVYIPDEPMNALSMTEPTTRLEPDVTETHEDSALNQSLAVDVLDPNQDHMISTDDDTGELVKDDQDKEEIKVEDSNTDIVLPASVGLAMSSLPDSSAEPAESNVMAEDSDTAEPVEPNVMAEGSDTDEPEKDGADEGKTAGDLVLNEVVMPVNTGLAMSNPPDSTAEPVKQGVSFVDSSAGEPEKYGDDEESRVEDFIIEDVVLPVNAGLAMSNPADSSAEPVEQSVISEDGEISEPERDGDDEGKTARDFVLKEVVTPVNTGLAMSNPSNSTAEHGVEQDVIAEDNETGELLEKDRDDEESRVEDFIVEDVVQPVNVGLAMSNPPDSTAVPVKHDASSEASSTGEPEKDGDDEKNRVEDYIIEDVVLPVNVGLAMSNPPDSTAVPVKQDASSVDSSAGEPDKDGDNEESKAEDFIIDDVVLPVNVGLAMSGPLDSTAEPVKHDASSEASSTGEPEKDGGDEESRAEDYIIEDVVLPVNVGLAMSGPPDSTAEPVKHDASSEASSTGEPDKDGDDEQIKVEDFIVEEAVLPVNAGLAMSGPPDSTAEPVKHDASSEASSTGEPDKDGDDEQIKVEDFIVEEAVLPVNAGLAMSAPPDRTAKPDEPTHKKEAEALDVQILTSEAKRPADVGDTSDSENTTVFEPDITFTNVEAVSTEPETSVEDPSKTVLEPATHKEVGDDSEPMSPAVSAKTSSTVELNVNEHNSYEGLDQSWNPDQDENDVESDQVINEADSLADEDIGQSPDDAATQSSDLAIEPYLSAFAFGGETEFIGAKGEKGKASVIVLSACYLPDRSTPKYDFIMRELFNQVLAQMEEYMKGRMEPDRPSTTALNGSHDGAQQTESLETNGFILIYFQGGAKKTQFPKLKWLKSCHDKLGRTLKKSIHKLVIVHPTLWTRTAIFWSRPFISKKFLKKLSYAPSLEKLNQVVNMVDVTIPEPVTLHDIRHGHQS